MITIRQYHNTDYQQWRNFLSQEGVFGGVIDEARDAQEKLATLAQEKPDCLLVAESEGGIVGTVTVFEDSRACWLYRFAFKDNVVGQELWDKAREVAKQRGHTQVIVYGPTGDQSFEKRYNQLGFNTGNSYTAYWQNIE